MLILAFFLNIIIMVLLRTLYIDLQSPHTSSNSTADRNMSLENLVSSYFMESWFEDQPKSTALKSSIPSLQTLDEAGHKNEELCSESNEKCTKGSILSLSTKGDKKISSHSFGTQIESLFVPPKKKVQPDWKVVLGTFSHYDDQNWREFLIKAEVPILLRMLVENLSETISFSKEHEDNINTNKQNQELDSSNEILLRTTVWLVSHDVKFHLGKAITEYDFFDGQYSESLFFFFSPRLLIQNKVKDNRRVSILRHFDEKGLNATLFDRDKIAVAKRFYHRVE